MRKYKKQTLVGSLKIKLPQKAFLLDEKQIEQLKTAGQIVLALVAAAGVIAVAAVAPNVLKLFKSVPNLRKSLRTSNRPAQKIAQTFYYLKRKGYVKLQYKNGEILAELTQSGQKRLVKMSYQNLTIPKSKVWDGRWWFVLADIPTKDYRSQANSLRRKIKALGLYPLQRTVWVYPFNPADQIAFVCGKLLIDRFVTVLRSDKLEDDDEKVLREFFKNAGIL